MGFLTWLGLQPEENSEETQLNLLEDSSTPVRGRVDGATVRNDFTSTIVDKGGDGQTIARSTNRMTEILFGCKPKELYEGTGGRSGDRSTLPQDAQTAYIVGEVAATHKLKGADIKGNQQQCNEQIVETVEEASEQVQSIFPWLNAKNTI
jgi:hypothetical protein